MEMANDKAGERKILDALVRNWNFSYWKTLESLRQEVM